MKTKLCSCVFVLVSVTTLLLSCTPYQTPTTTSSTNPTNLPIQNPSASPNISSSGKNVSVKENLTSEESQFLAMILTEISTYYKNHGQFLIVSPKTYISFNYKGDESNAKYFKDRITEKLNKGDYDFSILLGRLLEANRASVPISIISSPENGYYIDYDDKFKQYYQNGIRDWKQWYLDNPGAAGYAHVSIPAYDIQSGYLLVYASISHNGTNGGGWVIAYRFINNQLNKIGSVVLWNA